MSNTEIGKKLEKILPKERIKARLIDLVSYASDAGFYYLRPQAVVQPISETEIKSLFLFSHQHKTPITFRAGGTSLSGQSITDGILVDLSRYWQSVKIEQEGKLVKVQPGVTGGIVNAILKKHKKKIGPDPSSISSAMMGGILSNNSSGMCCGVKLNSYHTTKYIRFILPDGNSFSTESPADYERFSREVPHVYNKIGELRDSIENNATLHSRIRHKYQTKNTVGYSLNAFIDYKHPLDILAHLLIGAEGTLGFIAEATMETITDEPFKSTGLLYFPDIYAACRAIVPLTQIGAEAVELMDRASLRSIENAAGVPANIKLLPESAAALLIEFQGDVRSVVDEKLHAFLTAAESLSMLSLPSFTEDPKEQAFLWKLRKGMFPAVGAVRASGTTVILEDIAFPVHQLGDAILDLHALFKKYAYHDAIIFGHAKDGNIHFVVTQTFNAASEVERYAQFMDEVVDLVVKKYDGTLKAEHGTGRNMAPFVETEWGTEAYQIMKSLKETIDPQNLLNPGVIINEDAKAHLKHLKPLPVVEEEVDKCIECGYCEHKCPSRDLTLTPRRRIVVRRELAILRDAGNTSLHATLLDQYQYDGLETCAVDGLCATACPVDINTGDLVKRLRAENHSVSSSKIALKVAQHFGAVSSVIKFGLTAGTLTNKLFGAGTMSTLTKGLKRIVPAMPLWSMHLKKSDRIPSKYFAGTNKAQEASSIVYFPACISRLMGGAENGKPGLIDTFLNIAEKASIPVIIPDNINTLCCSQIFSSKGYKDAYDYMANKAIETLWKVSNSGQFPIVLDVTSCTQTLLNCRKTLTSENKLLYDQMEIIDSVQFVHQYIIPRVEVKQKKDKIVLHPVCSLQKMNLESQFLQTASHFAHQVEVPLHAGCCGMAGDRGFLFPELTHAATKPEADEVKKKQYNGYYASSKPCEMALSEAVGKSYESILYLVDETTQ